MAALGDTNQSEDRTQEERLSVLKSIFETTSVRGVNDAIVLCVHGTFILGGFQCLAVGESGFESGSSRSSTAVSTATSPAPPPGWNTSSDSYCLQYRHCSSSTTIVLVKMLPLGDMLLINALCSCALSQVHTVTLSTAEYANIIDSEGTRLSVVSKLDTEVIKKFRKYIVSNKIPDYESYFKDTTTKGGKQDKGVPPHYSPLSSRQDPLRVSPFNYGAGDLSPFGGSGGMIMDPLRGGGLGLRGPGIGPGTGPGMGPGIGPSPPSGSGGMIMDPFRGGGLGLRGPGIGPGTGPGMGPGIGPSPPRFHPPGARYDPVAPSFHPGRPLPRGGYPGIEPDLDHLPPPGYDDMFS